MRIELKEKNASIEKTSRPLTFAIVRTGNILESRYDMSSLLRCEAVWYRWFVQLSKWVNMDSYLFYSQCENRQHREKHFLEQLRCIVGCIRRIWEIGLRLTRYPSIMIVTLRIQSWLLYSVRTRWSRTTECFNKIPHDFTYVVCLNKDIEKIRFQFWQGLCSSK